MTSACGVIENVKEPSDQVLSDVTAAARARQKGQEPVVYTVKDEEAAAKLEKKLFLEGHHTMVLGEESKDQIAYAVRLLYEAGLIVIVPEALLTDEARAQVKPEEVLAADV